MLGKLSRGLRPKLPIGHSIESEDEVALWNYYEIWVINNFTWSLKWGSLGSFGPVKRPKKCENGRKALQIFT